MNVKKRHLQDKTHDTIDDQRRPKDRIDRTEMLKAKSLSQYYCCNPREFMISCSDVSKVIVHGNVLLRTITNNIA